jgi:Mg/Co/Ni transporter MgtE
MEAQRALAARYACDFPADAARRLESVPASELASYLADIAPKLAVRIIDSMLPSAAADAFEMMNPDALSEILDALSEARCVIVLRAVAKTQRARLLALLPKKTALTVKRLLRAPAGSAGVMAEPVTAVLSQTMTVREAGRVVHGLGEGTFYVVDRDYRLVGVVHRQDLAASDEQTRIGTLMSREVVKLPSAAPLSAVRDHPAWIQHDEMPIVDGAGVLVGMIRHRRLRRLDAVRPPAVTAHRPPLAAFLDLGELYWASLASVMTAMAREKAAEVNDG